MTLETKILQKALQEIHEFTTLSESPKTREEAIAYLHLIAIGSEVALREAAEAAKATAERGETG